MGNFRADLHCHTTYSDGTLTPNDIVQLACSLNIQGLSITDHDTIAAYHEFLPLAQAKNLLFVPGIELSAVHRKTSVHILAYSFSLTSSILAHFCQQHHLRRKLRFQTILDLLSSKGMPLSFEDFPQDLLSLQSQHSIGRPHIASAMIKKGYVQSIQHAFHEFLGEGKSCYIPSTTFSVEETIEVIHKAKGLAVIAHPHLIHQAEILKDLLDMDFDGIEGYYGRFTSSAHKRWLKIGGYKGWLITGGSDFHGTIKPHLPLGSSG